MAKLKKVASGAKKLGSSMKLMGRVGVEIGKRAVSQGYVHKKVFGKKSR